MLITKIIYTMCPYCRRSSGFNNGSILVCRLNLFLVNSDIIILYSPGAGVGRRGGCALGPLLRVAGAAAAHRRVAPHVRGRRLAARAAARALRSRR